MSLACELGLAFLAFSLASLLIGWSECTRVDCCPVLQAMKPLLLHGHERALTSIKFNLEGDLLFSSSKDKVPCVWFTHNGERLGTYQGHGGAVWSVDPTYDSKKLLTGAADNTAKIWDVETGMLLCTWRCMKKTHATRLQANACTPLKPSRPCALRLGPTRPSGSFTAPTEPVGRSLSCAFMILMRWNNKVRAFDAGGSRLRRNINCS